MAELPATVARLVADASGFVEGVTKANASTRDWQAELAKADLASRKAGVSAEAASLRAASAMRKAADAATALAAAQTKAADAAAKLEAGEISQEAATTAANTAAEAQVTALEAQQRAAITAERAAITNTQAQATAAAGARTAAAETRGAADTQATAAGRVSSTLDRMGKTSALILAGVGYESVKMAGTFQQQTSVLVTAAGELPQNLQKVRDGILGIASQTGTAWKEVTAGVYVAEKAGYRGADALNIVRASAQGAREEQASLSTVLNATTSVMASYHLKAGDAVMVTDEIKTAAGESKTTMEQFSGSLSTVIPIASSLKISFADAAGALATLTQHGTTADEATQELAATMRNLAVPNQVAVNEMSQLGISAVDVSNKLGDGPGGRGFAGTLNYLYDTIIKKLGPSGNVILDTFNKSKLAASDAQTEFKALGGPAQILAKSFEDGTIGLKDYRSAARNLGGEQGALALQFLNTYTNAQGFQQQLKTGGSVVQTADAALRKMTGGAIGLNTILQLTGDNAKPTADRIAKVGDAAKNAGQDVSGWEQTSKLAGVNFDKFKQSVETLAIKLGTALLPALSGIAGELAKHPGIIQGVLVALGLLAGRWIVLKTLGMLEFFGRIAIAITGIGTASAAAAGEAGVARLTTVFAGLKLLGVAGLLTGIAIGLDKIATASNKTKDKVADSLGLNLGSQVNSMLGNIVKFTAATKDFQNTATKRAAAGFVLGNANSPEQLLRGAQAMKTLMGDVKTLNTDNQNYAKTLAGLSGQLAANVTQFGSVKNAAAANRTTIVADLQATALHAEKTLALTGNLGLARKQFLDGIGVIANNSAAVGYNRDKVIALLQQLHLIPPFVKIPVSAPGLAEATAGVTFLGRDIASLPNKVLSVVAQTGLTGWLASVVGVGQSSPNTGVNGLFLKAAGGYISGPGTPTSDSIPAMLSDGEFVINAAATKAFLPLLAAINGGYADGGLVRKMAAGGIAVNTSVNMGGLDAALQSFPGRVASTMGTQVASAEKSAIDRFMKNLMASAGSAGAGVQRWAPLVMQVLAMLGQSPAFLPNVLRQMQTESGGNPGASNQWDSNAAIGQASQGLMQTIPATFAAFAGPFGGLGITNPLANVYAGLNYALHRYGTLGVLGQGHGYAKGGLVRGGDGAALPAFASGGYVSPATWQMLGGLRNTINTAGSKGSEAAFLNAAYATGRTTKADVPKVELLARNSRIAVAEVAGYFNTLKPQLSFMQTYGTSAQKAQAARVSTLFTTELGHLAEDARQETVLAAKMRGQYGGLEFRQLAPGTRTRDYSYLASTHHATTTPPIHATITVQSVLDGKAIAQSTSKIQLNTERNNLTNGATAKR